MKDKSLAGKQKRSLIAKLCTYKKELRKNPKSVYYQLLIEQTKKILSEVRINNGHRPIA